MICIFFRCFPNIVTPHLDIREFSQSRLHLNFPCLAPTFARKDSKFTAKIVPDIAVILPVVFPCLLLGATCEAIPFPTDSGENPIAFLKSIYHFHDSDIVPLVPTSTITAASGTRGCEPLRRLRRAAPRCSLILSFSPLFICSSEIDRKRTVDRMPTKCAVLHYVDTL